MTAEIKQQVQFKKEKLMKVSKKFRWEGAHRLPWHQGGCQSLHGHSYVLWVELEGEPDERGMLIDFKVIKKIISPLIESWDHATLIAKDDTKLKEAIALLNSKHFILPYDTTSENLCLYVAQYLLKKGFKNLSEHRIDRITVRLQETESCYAESSTVVSLEHPSSPESFDSKVVSL